MYSPFQRSYHLHHGLFLYPSFVPIHHSLSTSEAYYAIGEEKKGTMYYSIIYFENKHYLFISSDYLLSTSYELYTSQSDFSSLENNTSQ